MTWFRVDDKLAANRKVLRIPRAHRVAAMGLWAMAGSWCSSALTDGAVPAYMPEELAGDEQLALQLVAVGLWHYADDDTCPAGSDMCTAHRPAGMDDGWWFHEWKQCNPLKAEVEADREWNRVRAELQRDKALLELIRERDQDRCRYCGVAVRWSDRRSATGATYDHVTPRGPNTAENVVVACRACNMAKGPRTPEEWGRPLLNPGSMGTESVSNTDSVVTENYQAPVPSRPDPTRPTSKTTASQSSPRKRGTRLPEDWRPDDELADEMRAELGDVVDLYAEHRKFRDYWLSTPGQKGVKLDWRATWRNWMRSAAERGSSPIRSNGHNRPASAGGIDLEAAMARAEAREAAAR